MAGSDTKAPYITKINPASGAKDIAIASDIVIDFSEPVIYGEGSIQLVNVSTGETLKIFASDKQLNLNGSTLTINPSADLALGSEYTIYIDSGFVKDEANNLIDYTKSLFYTIADSTGKVVAETVNLPPQQGLPPPTSVPGQPGGTPSTPIDTTPPTIKSFFPLDESKAVAVSTNIEIRFSEPIQLGDGEIVIKKDTGEVIERYGKNSLNITTSATTGVYSNSDFTLWINPTADLNYSTNYKVEFTSGAIFDMSGNAYVGIDNYKFTTSANIVGHGMVLIDAGVVDFSNAVEIQKNGEIVIGGNTIGAGVSSDSFIFKISDRGVLNKSFGVGGFVRQEKSWIYGLSVKEGNGVVVVGGGYQLLGVGLPVKKYNSVGDLDTTFSNDGLISVGADTTAKYGMATSVVNTSDGGILVGGSLEWSDKSDFIIAKYFSNGQPDTSWGVNGERSFDFNEWDYLKDLAIQADGKVLIAATGKWDNYKTVLARVDSNGTLDQTFGINGKVVTDRLVDFYYLNSMSLGIDGSIILCGEVREGGHASGKVNFLLLRYTTKGEIDKTFGGNGRVTIEFNDYAYAFETKIQEDGKIIVAGMSGGIQAGSRNLLLARLNQDGTLDSGFGEGGKVVTSINGNQLFPTGVALDAHGRIVVVTNVDHPDNTNFVSTDIAILRYLPNGQIDGTFGSVENAAPIADDSYITISEDTSKQGTLTAIDKEYDSLRFSAFEMPINGTVTVNKNGTYTYTPNSNFNGTDSFTFKANDGALDSAAATVSITVTAVNDAPIATAVSISTNEDTAKTGTLTATDVDSTALTYSKVTGPTNGSVTVNTNGTYTYTPNANFNGTDSFTFVANDGALHSAAAKVSITVAAVNDAPTGEIIYHGKFIEGQTISADISKITDPEGIGIAQYIWKRDSVIVQNGQSAYYTISDTDIDHIVSVDVKYLDGGGTLESIKGSEVNKVTALGDLRELNFNITQNINGVVVSGSVKLSETFSKAKSIALLFWKEGDQQTWINLNRDSSGLFVFEQKLDKYASSGSYAVRAIDAVDDFGASIRFTEQKMIELGYQTKSVLVNSYSDSTKPAVKSFEISNFHFNDLTQTWDVDYKLLATDDKSGLKAGHIVEFLSPTGTSLQEWRDFNSEGVISTTRSFSKYTASGIYKISTIRIWDVAGNDGTLGYTDLKSRELTSQLILNNPYADNKAPTLEKFNLAATFNSVTLRPSIVIDFGAVDDVSGFKNSYIRMADVNGVLEDRWIEDQDMTKAGVQFNLDLVQEYTSGKFKIQYLNLYDKANNSSSLVYSDLLKSGYAPEINVFFKPVGASDDYVIKAMDSDDWLIGSSGNDILDGGKGQDFLYSGPGNDYVSAGEGDDLIVGGEGAGNDTYVGGTGTDTIKYTSAVNTILVNLLTGLANGQDIGTDQLSQIENLIGGQTGDTLIGDNNANNINAYTGNDTITGNGGNDTIDGGEGQDTVVYALNASSYTVTAITGGYQVVAKTGNEGTDTLLNVESLKFANKTVVAADFVAAGGEKEPAVAKFWKDNTKAPTDTKKADAVNLTDAIAILKMIVGLNVNSNNTPLSPYQAIAADFDQDGGVGLTDAIGVLKMVVGLSAPTPTWKYYDDAKLANAYTSAQSLNPKGWTSNAVISDTGTADGSVKLIGVLTGDVDGSWTG